RVPCESTREGWSGLRESNPCNQLGRLEPKPLGQARYVKLNLVRVAGFEPACLTAQNFQSCVSTNSTRLAESQPRGSGAGCGNRTSVDSLEGCRLNQSAKLAQIARLAPGLG